MQSDTRQINFDVSRTQAAFLYSTEKFVAGLGGYGSGKTTVLADSIILSGIQNLNKTGMVVASDFGRLSRDLLPKLFERLDLYEIKSKWVKQAMPGLTSRALMIGPGWINATVQIGSADSPDSLKGPTLSWISVEEGTLLPRYIPGKSEPLWVILISRLREEGGTHRIRITGTPEGRGNWTCDPGRFETAPDDVNQMDTWSRTYRIVRMPTWSNRWLPSDYVSTMADNLDPQQQKEKIEGVPAAGIGSAAYYAFDRARHVAPTNYDRYRGMVYVGLDFNVNPICSTLSQFHKRHFHVFDEIALPHSNTPSMCRALIARLAAIGLKPQQVEVCPDASGRARTTIGRSDFQILKAFGFVNLRYPKEGNPLVRDRLASVNGALYHGRVTIDPRCRGLIRDLINVSLDDAGDIAKSNAELSHLSDGFGYVVNKVMPVRYQSAATRVA